MIKKIIIKNIYGIFKKTSLDFVQTYKKTLIIILSIPHLKIVMIL